MPPLTNETSVTVIGYYVNRAQPWIVTEVHLSPTFG